MGMMGARMRMVEIPDWNTLAKDLEVRTGLIWTVHDNARPESRSWSSCTLRVTRFNWEVDVARRVDSDIIGVEAMPQHWRAMNYHYWQVLAALHARGGTRISGNGQVRTIKFPRWISRRWDEMPWWCRYQR